MLDFGSQYSHLICRRIRDFAVRAVLLPHDAPEKEIAATRPKGIILSGGPASVYEKGSPRPDGSVFGMGVPVLGICYGHQLIVERFGGRVRRANKEYGPASLSMDGGAIFDGMGPSTTAWMSHGDEAEEVPAGFEIIGHTDGARAAAIASKSAPVYGIQFHPEVAHTQGGSRILENFAAGVCGAKKEWTMDAFVREATESISQVSGRVLCGVSGGVDSTVAALLIHRAIGDRLQCVFIDNGLLRQGEADQVRAMFSGLGVPFEAVDASSGFLSRLRGVADPEEKRKAVGDEFARVFSQYAKESGPFEWLAQGTLYPDIIESGVSGGPAEVIKSHHNVGGLPDWLGLKVLEPLKELYKDEVRRAAAALGVDPAIYGRHPFPGPGLAVRVIGEATPEKVAIARAASHIVEEELRAAGLYEGAWQAYAMVGDDRAVGVVGDRRRYGRIVTVRIVSSTDAMTADWLRVPDSVLEAISTRITNQIEEVTWVAYAISSKPPATIEPQ